MNFSATPRGTTPVILMFLRDSIVRGNTHSWSISLLVALSSAAEFSTEWDDLWFPLGIIGSKSVFVFPLRLDLDGNDTLSELC